MTIKEHKNSMLKYSDKKNIAKNTPPYSTLYPATNSPSASGKSKGALFVSANEAIKKKQERNYMVYKP